MKNGRRRPGRPAAVAFAFFIFHFAFCAAALAAEGSANSTAGGRGWYAVLDNGFSVRHMRREELGATAGTTRLWLGADARAGYVDLPTSQIVRFEQEEVAPAPVPAEAAGLQLHDLVNAAGDRHQVDADFVASVVRAESGFNPRAVSPKGAQGLMQLMPQTASRLGVPNSFDPAANVEGGTRYLRALLDQYHGDAVRALAAYNAGPQRVRQYGGVPPYRETRAYVSRVIRDFNRKKIAADPSLAQTRGRAKARAHHEGHEVITKGLP